MTGDIWQGRRNQKIKTHKRSIYHTRVNTNSNVRLFVSVQTLLYWWVSPHVFEKWLNYIQNLLLIRLQCTIENFTSPEKGATVFKQALPWTCPQMWLLPLCCWEGNGPWGHTPLDASVCAVGRVALAGQVSPCPLGRPLGMERRRERRMSSPQGEATRRDPGLGLHCFQVPSPTPSREANGLSAFESPTVLLVLSLIYFFWPNPVPGISPSVTKQFISETKGRNLSHLKNNPAIKRIDSPSLGMAVKSPILCGLQKCFSINYPTLIRRIWFPTSITDFF